MHALVVSQPWGIENIKMVEVSKPEPGLGEVRLRMRAVSLNYRDLLIANGSHVRGALSSKSIVPFGDGCGVVDALGDDVTRVTVGQRVIPTLLPKWISGPPTRDRIGTARGMNIPGLGQEYVVVHQDACVEPASFTTKGRAEEQ